MILAQLVRLEIKARRSLAAPRSKKSARRRLTRYEDLAATAHPRSPTGAIARGEANRLRDYLASTRFGRGMTEGRAVQEEVRHGLRQNAKHRPKRKKSRAPRMMATTTAGHITSTDLAAQIARRRPTGSWVSARAPLAR
jgi:hypothetical protein